MPYYGSVYIPDELTPQVAVQRAPRPGFGEVVASAARDTARQLRYGVPYAAEKLAGTLTPDDERAYQQALGQSSLAPAASLEDVTSGRVGVLRFIGENLAQSLPYMAGSAAGGIGGFITGGGRGAVVGAIGGGIPQFVGSNVERAVNEEGGLSQRSAARAFAVAPLQSAADVAIGRFLPGAGRVLGDAAATQTGGIVRRTAASIAKAGATEAVTEAAQQVGERYVAGLPLASIDAAKEYVTAAVTAFAVGGVMGSFGGIRSNATSKPAAQVTQDDARDYVDQVLLGLPAPADFVGLPDGTTAVNPAGRSVLSLPSPEQFGRTPGEFPDEVIVDAAGRAALYPNEPAQGLAPDDRQTLVDNVAPVLANTPRPAQPTMLPDEILAQLNAGPPGAPPLLASTTLSRGLGLPTQEPSAPAAPATPSDPILQNIQRDAEEFKTFLAEQKQGLRGGFVQQVDATNEVDLLTKVHEQIFDNQDTRSNTVTFAKRLGILNDKLEPTPLADAIAAMRQGTTPQVAPEPEVAAGVPQVSVTTPQAAATTPQAPAASAPPRLDLASSAAPAPAPAPISQPEVATPAFKQEWRKTLASYGIKRLATGKVIGEPTSMADAEQRVMRALADPLNLEQGNRDADKGPSQVELLARKMGLVTDDAAMDLTPKGRKVYLASPEGSAAISEVAQSYNYDPARTSAFERGARSVVAGGQGDTQFGSFEDMAAHQAGRVWAQKYIDQGDRTLTARETEAQQQRLLGSAASVETAPRPRVSRDPSPAQTQRKALNDLIDMADLMEVPDQEITALRRLVADGATVADVSAAIQKLQGGGTIRMAPPRKPFRWAGGLDGPGQPRFREMRDIYDPKGPSRAEQRFETEGAVRAYELRQLIRFALDEKGITERRAEVLNDLLDKGKIDRVARMLKDFDETAAPRKRLPKPPEQLVESSAEDLFGRPDLKLEQAIAGKTFDQVLDIMVEQAPSKFMRLVMKNVQTLAQRLQKAGVTFEIQIVQAGDKVPRVMLRQMNRALTQSWPREGRAKVWLKSSSLGGRGVNYQLVAHEMVHAVTQLLLRHGNIKSISGTGTIGNAVSDLYDLANAVIEHFNTRAREGNLTEFERRYLNREHNALADVDEILAWTLTNPETQRYMASIEYKPRQSVFGRLVELLRNLLGLEKIHDTALAELLRVSEQITATPVEEITAMLERNKPGEPMIEAQAAEAAPRTAAGMQERTQAAAAMVTSALDKLVSSNARANWRRGTLAWLSHNQLDRAYGEQMPGLLQHSDAHRERTAVRSRFEQMGDDAYQRFEKLEVENKNAAEWLGQLMALSTEFQLDPSKPWEAHKHHHNDKNAAQLEALHKRALKMRNDLSRDGGEGWALYNQFRALNEAQNYARMAASLHSLVTSDPEMSQGVADATVNPVDQFMRLDNLADAAAVRDHWYQALQRQVASTVAYVNRQKEAAAGEGASANARMSHYLSPIELQVSAIHEALAGMQKAPYFHLGRFGDFFGSAVIRRKDGVVDPAAQQYVAEALEKAGFNDVQISADNTRPRISLRFATLDQAQGFQQLMRELGRQGWLEEGWDSSTSENVLKVGPRSRADNYGTADGMPAYVQQYIQALEADPMFVADEDATAEERAHLQRLKAEMVRMARDTWLDQQPDTSISKVLTKRYVVPGYHKDMIRNFAHRWRVGSISLANVAAAPKFRQAYTAMRAQVNQATLVDVAEATKLNDVMTELKIRDATNPINEEADTFDKARAVAHSYFLGMSPAYAMINMTQLGVTALPELAKTHGYRRSFHAMRRATVTAGKVLKAAIAEARRLGPKHYADLAITETVLQNAGLDAAERSFALHMLATGTIDIGSAARALGQVAEGQTGSKLDVTLRYASALGLYTETLSRLITAFSARELHGSKPGVEQYAAKVVSNSMFDYQNWNTARRMGKQGFAGPLTPIITQFMSYSVQLTEKLYSEALDAFQRPRPGESEAAAKARKVAARKFLTGHLTAVMTLAGTLGLPFATVFATVLERMVDAFDDDDEPFDVTAAWRNLLADTLGPGMGEVVARGLPRAIGFDISSRTGEQNLMPFSEFLADRRPWKEKLGAMLDDKLGAAPSMVSNIITGAGKMADGRVLDGMIDIVPSAFKGPLTTYRMTTDGYVDGQGNVLPMSPTAASYLWQALGFAPSDKAEYSEARMDQQSRRGEITRRAERLRRQIVQAMIEGDQQTAVEGIREAQQFDQDNPAFAVIPSLSGSLTRRMQNQARARALGTPLGVSQRDVAGQQLTRYANTGYAQ